MIMNIKKILALLTVPVILISCISCSSDKEKGAVVPAEVSESYSDEKPVLSIEEVEISYSELDHENGTIVPVNYSVSGIVNGWSSSGIHIAYDDRISVEADEITGTPSFETGEASRHMNSVISIFWQGENPPDELSGKNMDNITMITSDSSDKGGNGVIASINFRVPADAKAGDIYAIEFFRYKTDCFFNKTADVSMQEFAFENWKNGYIKITE